MNAVHTPPALRVGNLAMCRSLRRNAVQCATLRLHFLPVMNTTQVPATPRSATPMAFARAMAQALDARGLNSEAMLQSVQITPSELQREDARISAAQMEQLSARCMQALDDEALGWFERPLPWGSYGMLARASLSAPTLSVALKRWCRHHGLLTRAVGLTLHSDGETAVLRLDAPGVRASDLEFCCVTLLRNVLGFASWIIDSRIALRAVHLPCAAPAHVDAYAVLFPCPVVFDAPRAEMQFDARYLALPPCRSDADARAMLQRALPLTVLHYRRDRLLVAQVRQLLQQQAQHMRDARSVADALAMSERSLHRQLKAQGASLQGLKNSVRAQHAQQLLRQTTWPLKQVAQAVGFRHEKSFIRAFHGWTGSAPAAFRTQGR